MSRERRQMKEAKGRETLGTDHDSVVAHWRQNAEANDEKNYKFLHSLKRRDYGFDPDELAGKLHQEAFQIIDCTRCANCCKTMDVVLNEADIEQIAAHLQIAPEELIEAHLERDEEGEYVMRQKPCPFLGSDERCTIYEVRPGACREFPHTDKEGFVFRAKGHANNAMNCPAVHWIVEQMRRQAQRTRRE